MRFRSFTRSLAGLAFSLLFLLTAHAAPAFAKSGKLKIRPKPPLQFGEVIVGLTSPTQFVTLTNESNTFAIPLTTIRVTLPFIKVSTTCAAGISAGSNCQVGIAFKPTAAGKVHLSKGLTVTGTFQGGSKTYELRGTGVIGPTPTPTVSATQPQARQRRRLRLAPQR